MKPINKDMLITTTNTIENGKITKYLDVVSSNIVVGVNVFSEFMASFTDFFGGNSGTYENKLNKIFSESLNNLSKKARKLGADAIVGLKLDYEEISGKDKSMIMVYAMGSAVKVSFESNQQMLSKIIESSNSEIIVTCDELSKYMFRRKYEEKFTNIYPSQEDYEYITQNDIYGLEQVLFNLYTEIDIKRVDDQIKTVCHNLLNFQLDNVTFDDACELVYSKATEMTCRLLVCRYIIERRLFNPHKILEFLNQGENKVATMLLEAEKDFYTKEDYIVMQEIVIKLDALSNSNYSLDNDQKLMIKRFKEKVEYLNSYAQSGLL